MAFRGTRSRLTRILDYKKPYYWKNKMLKPRDTMRRYALFPTGLLLIVLIIACPVQAFTAKSLDIVVQDNTDAVITFDYDLTWYENIAVFARITDPGIELKKALESNFNKPVEVVRADTGRSQFYVQGFASGQEHDGTVTLTTPALSFREAENILKQYWFAPIIHPDFSPDVTRIIFADGYVQTFSNQDRIPAVSHTL
jgi:hypothetical protein